MANGRVMETPAPTPTKPAPFSYTTAMDAVVRDVIATQRAGLTGQQELA